LFWHHPDEPYTFPEGKRYDWLRARVVGGRSMFWGRIVWRLNPHDFKTHSYDGYGTDWPIGYEDLEPYYDKVETFIGVTGNKDGIVDSPDGKFQKPLRPSCSEVIFSKAVQRLGIPVIPIRKAILTENLNGRMACHYCGRCGNGCETRSNFNSFDVAIPVAKATGRLTIIPNAVVREVTVDPKTGRASGAAYVDRKTFRHQEVKAKVVVLAAGCVHTARIMLNSKSTLFPNGIANNNGLVGKHFLEHMDVDASALMPDMVDAPVTNDDGANGGHIVIPWWGWDRKDLPFVKGYHIEIGSGFRTFPPSTGYHGHLFGAPLKKALKSWYGTRVGFHSHGELLPSKDNYIELDEKIKDKWGIPAVKFHVTFGENEMKMFRHARDTYSEIFKSLGCVDQQVPDSPLPPGASAHEMGTCIMGSSQKESVLNKYCQAWEVKNLFIADGSSFPSASHKNPTLTICAVSWRMSDYLADQFKKGNL
jgi:choline dehydrogenase-like flavoprotein